MGSPTNDYLQREKLVNSALKSVNLGGLEAKFEQPQQDSDFDDDDFGDDLSTGTEETMSTLPPNHVGFYDGNKKVGELYFTEPIMRLEVLDPSFKPYENVLRAYLKL